MKRLVIACTLLAVVASACSSDSTESAEATTTSSGGDAAGSATTTVAAATTSTAAATTSTVGATSTTIDVAAGLDSCVVGAWEMDSDKFFEDVLAFAPQEGVEGEFVHVGGAYLLIIGGDGTFEARRDNWTFGVTSDFGDLEVVINASQLGTYELEGDMLSTRVEPGEPAEIVIKIDGEPFEFPGGASPIAPPEAEFSGATVTCDGDMLTATADEFSSVWSRAG